MEELEDFDSFIKNYEPPLVTYMAVFNPDTGEVMKVGPSYAFDDEQYKILIDDDLASKIIEGEIRISSCTVNTHTSELEIAETKVVFKMDDVLHRIVDRMWSDIEYPDVYLTYDTKKKQLKVELSIEFGGTKDTGRPNIGRKIIWSGDTEMNFLITDYNDPNVLYELVPLRLSDLISNAKVIENLELPNKFSIYTRRLFKNYVMEKL